MKKRISGGRARQLKLMILLSTWDRWYWMPDVLIVFSLILEKKQQIIMN
jgi:hypothetical protein